MLSMGFVELSHLADRLSLQKSHQNDFYTGLAGFRFNQQGGRVLLVPIFTSMCYLFLNDYMPDYDGYFNKEIIAIGDWNMIK